MGWVPCSSPCSPWRRSWTAGTSGKTLEGQQAAAAKGNHGGRPKVVDDDMLLFARALKDHGTPIPQIVAKLTIKTGKNVRKAPSVASLYRALADTDAPQLTGPP